MELKKVTLQCIHQGCSWEGSNEEYQVSKVGNTNDVIVS